MAREYKPKTRNHGTMTEAAFWSWLRSGIRRMFMYWKPAAAALEAAKRPYKGNNKLQKWEYMCAECGKWKKRTDMEKDHIDPCGQLTSYEDLVGFVKRMSVEVDGFQILCKVCHNSKSQAEKRNKT